MSFFCKIETEVIRDLTRLLSRALKDLKECRRRNRRPILALTLENQILMNTTLTLGSPFASQLTLIDNVTLQPVTATFSGQTVTTDAPSVATFVFDSVVPTQVDATPLAQGTGNIILSAVASYVNSLGQSVTSTLTATYAFSVIAGADGVTLSLTDFVPVSVTTTTTTTA